MKKQRKVKYIKGTVGYSESFIFRARCKACGSKPISKVYSSPNVNSSPSFEYFRSSKVRKSHYKPYYMAGGYLSYSGKLIKSVAHYIGNFGPTTHKRKEYSISKTMCCECGETWWVFKASSPQRSVKGIVPNN